MSGVLSKADLTTKPAPYEPHYPDVEPDDFWRDARDWDFLRDWNDRVAAGQKQRGNDSVGKGKGNGKGAKGGDGKRRKTNGRKEAGGRPSGWRGSKEAKRGGGGSGGAKGSRRRRQGREVGAGPRRGWLRLLPPTGSSPKRRSLPTAKTWGGTSDRISLRVEPRGRTFLKTKEESKKKN